MKPKTKSNKRRRIKKQTVWLVLGSAGVLAVAAWFFMAGTGEQLTASGAKLVHTMDPSYFSKEPKAQAAYQAAKDMPEVLAELPCFCGCMTGLGHESILFGFRDATVSGCTFGEEVALEARDLHQKGFSIDRIKELVREHFSGVH